MSSSRRSTRKRLLPLVFSEEFHNQPTFVSEFRWAMCHREGLERGRGASHMTDSYRKSFGRTLKHYQDSLRVEYVYVPWRSSQGVLARTALFELLFWDEISGVLSMRLPKAQFYFEAAGHMMMHWVFYLPQGHHARTALMRYEYQPVVVSADARQSPDATCLSKLSCQIEKVISPRRLRASLHAKH
jgi:hypothetical protein